MKHSLLVLLVACGGPAGATAPSNSGGAPPAIPDLAGVRASVAPHAQRRFDATAVADRGCPANQSLGEYVALLVMNGTGEPGSKDTHRLTGGCEEFPLQLAPIDPPSDAAYWYCRIDSYTVDPEGESPWHYELRLRIRKVDRGVDLATLGCPGTP